jgi:hypothetical protein
VSNVLGGIGDAASKAWDDATKAAGELVEGAERAIETGAGAPQTPDAANAWVPPWIQEYEFQPGSGLTYYNYEGGMKSVASDWQRDVDATALLAVTAGLAASVVLKQVSISVMLDWYYATLTGAALAYWRSYKGYAIQSQVTADVVPVHEWYGKYRINGITGTVDAVRFDGRGPTVHIATRITLFQRLVDARGNVLFLAPEYEHPISRRPDDVDPLPEFSFGY